MGVLSKTERLSVAVKIVGLCTNARIVLKDRPDLQLSVEAVNGLL